ncbi:MAG: hypothetical protein KIT60_17375 [Burkholderiaceae bacterium]|nr:hypothetical protein [Burkholderiaceae bacterium]
MASKTIWLHRNAPPKPTLGEACTGCGVCCACEPCPAGMLLTLRRRGRCRMLRFDSALARYRCALMPPLSGTWLQRLQRALAARCIGAGLGCDSTVEAIAPPDVRRSGASEG